MMSGARLVMRKRLPLREWKYEIMVRPFCHCFFALRWTMPYGIVKSFLNPHLYRDSEGWPGWRRGGRGYWRN